MKQMIYQEHLDQPKAKPRYFALLPTIVREAHPFEIRVYVLWLEWYEKDRNKNWLIT